MKKINDLINNSVKANSLNQIDKEDLADKLIKRADKAMGLNEINEQIIKTQNTRKSLVKNVTFSFEAKDHEILNSIIKRYIKQGEIVNRSEIIRIGLKIIENINDDELMDLLNLINRHNSGGWIKD